MVVPGVTTLDEPISIITKLWGPIDGLCVFILMLLLLFCAPAGTWSNTVLQKNKQYSIANTEFPAIGARSKHMGLITCVTEL